MKKPLIALAASLAMVAGAEAETKLYGKFNVSATQSSYKDAAGDDASQYNLNSHASRLGVKGKEDLGSAKAIYKMEFEVYVDDGSKTSSGEDDAGDEFDYNKTFSQRNIYVGLDYGSAGSVRLGHFDTPTKVSQGKFDLFNDIVDFKNVLDGENRSSNQINYTTADMGGLKVSASTMMSEADGVGNGTSVSASYKMGGLYVAVAMDDNVKEESVQRVTAIYKAGDIRVGVLAQQVDEKDVCTDCDELGYAANVSFKMGKNTLKAQVETGDQKAEGTQVSTLGVDHKLGKATTAYALYTQSEDDSADSEVSTFGVGLIHKF